jgi:hypothetical protein
MTAALVIAEIIMIGIALYLIGSLIRSMIVEERRLTLKLAFRDFGLSIAFATLFLTSWIGQAIAEWHVFVDEQKAHGEEIRIVDFAQEFTQSTLENWQSEFLQLFSFTVLAALLIHKGSAESKDSAEEMQKALARIEKRLDAAGIGSKGS